jgi:hypothetical protein
MAELSISLERDPAQGRYVVRIGYRADADAIPFEHELLHRRLVTELFPGLEIVDDRNASVRVQREKPSIEPVVG